MNFNEEIPALPNNIFQNHYVLVFDLTSLQDAGKKFIILNSAVKVSD